MSIMKIDKWIPNWNSSFTFIIIQKEIALLQWNCWRSIVAVKLLTCNCCRVMCSLKQFWSLKACLVLSVLINFKGPLCLTILFLFLSVALIAQICIIHVVVILIDYGGPVGWAEWKSQQVALVGLNFTAGQIIRQLLAGQFLVSNSLLSLSSDVTNSNFLSSIITHFARQSKFVIGQISKLNPLLGKA